MFFQTQDLFLKLVGSSLLLMDFSWMKVLAQECSLSIFQHNPARLIRLIIRLGRKPIPPLLLSLKKKFQAI